MLLWAVAVSAQDGAMTLSAAISYALANNPDIKDAQLRVADADAQIKENTATGLPQLSASGSYQRYFKVPLVPLPAALTGGEPQQISFVLKNNITGAVNLDAMLFEAAYFVALKAARAAREYAQLDLADRQRKVRNQVREVYLPLLFLEANKEQLDKNIANLNRLYDETREIYKAGFAEQLDVDRLELSLANLRTERESLDRQYENALRALKFTLNLPDAQAITLADDLDALLTEASGESLTAAIDYGRRTEIGVLNQAILLNDYNVTAIKSRYLPSLRAFAGYQYQYQGDDFSSGFWAPTGFVGVSLNVPIYDGGYKRALVDRAKISREQVLLQRETVQRLITLEVTNARSTYADAQERLADRARNLELAQRIYDTTQIKFREGVGSSFEVNQAEQGLYGAQSAHLQARYELLRAKTALDEALGLQ